MAECHRTLGALWAHKTGLPPRITEDFDLIIEPSPKLDAYTVSEALATNAKTKAFFVSTCKDYTMKPFVKVGRVEIETEIFDKGAWGSRAKYYDLELPSNAVTGIKIGAQDVSTLNLGWILRQKILAYEEREKKRATDMKDISVFRG